MFDPWTFANILRDERARVVKEFNQCHTPPGGADGGQFCSKGGGGGGMSNDEKHAGIAAKHGTRSADAWRAAVERPRKAAFDAMGKHVPGFQPKRGEVAGSTSDPDTPYSSADVARGSQHWATRPQDAAKKVRVSSAAPFAGAFNAGGGTADPMIDFGGNVKRRSEYLADLRTRGPVTQADIDAFDASVRAKTRERLKRDPLLRQVHQMAGASPGGSEFAAAPKKVKHKMEYPAEGARKNPQHVATYRGMTINTLPSYTTPYYYVDAPGFGSMHHTPSIGRIRRQVDTFHSTGATAAREKKRKGSERYQKRKARYGS